MKKLVCAVIAVLLIGAYSAIWYLGCQGIEKRLLAGHFSLQLGPKNEVSINSSIRVSEVKYQGYFQGESTVQYKVDEASSSVAFSPDDKPKQILLEASAKPTGQPLVYSIGVPLWGKSVNIRTGKIDGLMVEFKSLAGKNSMLFSGDVSDASILLRNDDFIGNRESLVRELVADPKKIASELAGFRINKPFSMKIIEPSTQKLFMDYTYHGGGYGWNLADDGMFTVTYDMAMEGKYGPAFLDSITANQKALFEKTSDPLQLKATESLRDFINVLMGDGSIQTSGSVAISVPAARIGLLAKPLDSVESATPPFSVVFNNFFIKAPFFLTSGTTIDGKVGFQQAGGKPLLIDLSLRKQPSSDSLQLQKIQNALLQMPEVKALGFDPAKSDVRSIRSFHDLEGAQGAYVLAVSGITAFEKLILANATSLALELEISTASGQMNTVDLMGAQFSGKITGQLGNSIVLDVKGSGQGLSTWNASVSLKGLTTIMRELREPLSLAIVRSFASNLPGEEPSPEGSQAERDLLTFLFSDQLFLDVVTYIEKISQGFDTTPGTPDEMQMNFEGSSESVTINRKSPVEFQAELLARVQQEGGPLRQQLDAQFTRFGQMSE